MEFHWIINSAMGPWYILLETPGTYKHLDFKLTWDGAFIIWWECPGDRITKVNPLRTGEIYKHQLVGSDLQACHYLNQSWLIDSSNSIMNGIL